MRSHKPRESKDGVCALNSGSLRKTEYRSSTRRKVVASILPLRALSYSASASRSCPAKRGNRQPQ